MSKVCGLRNTKSVFRSNKFSNTPSPFPRHHHHTPTHIFYLKLKSLLLTQLATQQPQTPIPNSPQISHGSIQIRLKPFMLSKHAPGGSKKTLPATFSIKDDTKATGARNPGMRCLIPNLNFKGPEKS